MAGGTDAKTVSLTINGIEVTVPEGELIVESVKRLGLEIPVFCYHPRMKPVGMCRMCLVEIGFKQADGSVRMMPKPHAGCTLPASDGMVVVTDSESVHRDRRGVLEFLLINHPLDCPICDRGGECPLQNNTLAYGPSTTRFIELKRHLPKAFPLSKYVKLDLERCIQCGRCVRFTEEISGEHELAFRFRGANMQPSTFQLLDFESKFSGNVIEICPVGALTSAEYRFRARPWDLEAAKGVCTECSNGCNVWFDHRAGKFVRINGRVNEAVNEEWTCDKGKFGHEYYNSADRLTTPLVRRDGQFTSCSWSEAYDEIARGLDRPSGELACLAGPQVSNEGLHLMRQLFTETLACANIDHRWTVHPGTYESTFPIAELGAKSAVLVFGTDLSSHLPIVYLRLRKAAVEKGCKVVTVTSTKTDSDRFAAMSVVCESDGLASFAKDLAEGKGGPASAVSAQLGRGFVALVSDGVFDLPDGAAVVESLRAFCQSNDGEFCLMPRGANSMGAQILGVLPGPDGLDTQETLAALKSGQVKAVWLTDCDPATSESGKAALEASEFVVYQGTSACESMSYANVVLPMAAPAEQDGTWTNCEGRVQRMAQAIKAPGEAKPSWRIFAEYMLRTTPMTPFFNVGEVFEDIASRNNFFSALSLVDIPDEGIIVGPGRLAATAGLEG